MARPQLRGSDIDTPQTLPGESPSTQLPLLLLGVMEGGRMWREEVSFLQADCEMERLRDGQMTMAGRPGPESRLGEPCTLLRVGSGCYAKCTELRPSQQIWQGDPFIELPPPFNPSSSSSFPPHPSQLFLPSLTPNQEVMSWCRGCRKVWGCYLHHYHFVPILWQSNYVRSVF